MYTSKKNTIKSIGISLIIIGALAVGNMKSIGQKTIFIDTELLSQGRNLSLNEAINNAMVINKFMEDGKGKNLKYQLPAGVFEIGKPILIPSKATLMGTPEKTSIIIHPDFPSSQAYILNESFNLGVKTTDSGVAIENLLLDGSSHIKNAGNTMGIFFNKANNIRISGLIIIGVANEAIRIHSNFSDISATNSLIENCKIFKRGLSSKGIMISSFTSDANNESKDPAMVSNFKIRNNTIEGGDHGIILFNVKDGLVEGNRCTAQLTRGIIMSPTVSQVILKNNKVDSAGSTGIHMAYGCSNITVDGNSVSNSLKDMSGVGIEGQGIKAYAGFSNITIINNVCTSNATDGIALEGGGTGSNFNISGNTVNNNNRNGIRIWAGEITLKRGGNISNGLIEKNSASGNLEEPIYLGSDNNGKNKVMDTKIMKNNTLKPINGKTDIKQPFPDKSNSILKN